MGAVAIYRAEDSWATSIPAKWQEVWSPRRIRALVAKLDDEHRLSSTDLEFTAQGPDRGMAWRWTIRLGKDGTFGWIVLHEYAHCLTIRNGHGEDWQRIYTKLVTEHIGERHGRRLAFQLRNR